MPQFGWPHTSKPGRGATIDWTHPLARGLQGFYPLNEGAGPKAYDATGNLALTTTGAPTWTTGPNGIGLSCNASNAGMTATLPPSLRPGWPITIAFGVQLVGTPVSGIIGGLWGTPADLYWNSGSAALVSYVNGNSNQITTPAAIAAGAPSAISLSVTASTIAMYAGGVPVQSIANTYGVPSYSSSSFNIGGSGAGRVAATLYDWAGWWNREFSAAEHAALAANPWQIIAPGPLRSWVFFQGPATITASMAATLAASSFAGSASTRDPASMAVALSPSTFAGSAGSGAAGTMAVALAPSTFAGSATFTATASMAAPLSGSAFAGSVAFAGAASMAVALAGSAFAGSSGAFAAWAIPCFQAAEVLSTDTYSLGVGSEVLP